MIKGKFKDYTTLKLWNFRDSKWYAIYFIPECLKYAVKRFKQELKSPKKK